MRKKLAAIISKRREEKGLTKTDLAELVGCSRYTIIRIEKAEYSPGLDLVEKICNVLGITSIDV